MPRIALVVEDSRQFAATLEIALESIPNLALAYVSDGEEAIRYLESRGGSDVRALITDLHMPKMDGFELIAWLRASERHAKLPVVVLSGDSDPATPQRAYELGANAFFLKPYSPGEVRNTVERLLDRA
jgi:two-component system, chemotaxis family, sensor histidine kinase and response regulator PixL